MGLAAFVERRDRRVMPAKVRHRGGAIAKAAQVPDFEVAIVGPRRDKIRHVAVPGDHVHVGVVGFVLEHWGALFSDVEDAD